MVAGDANGVGTWSSTGAALVNAAVATRLEGELAWLQAVRETLQRMSAKHISAVARVEVPDATIG